MDPLGFFGAPPDENASERTRPAGIPSDEDQTVEPAVPTGTTVGRYTLLSLIGRGGMGSVYKAYDPQLDRNVALKRICEPRHSRRRHLGASARLLREAKTLASLSHPNVVSVFDAGLDDDGVYIAMELCDGVTLDQWLQVSRSAREVIDAFVQAARGLDAAHRGGFVHRDFKPANVFVGRDGLVRVLDFGLAHLNQAQTEDMTELGEPQDMFLTDPGIVLGTPAYMAPEQWKGERADGRTDQFSFCLALFWALYGHSPFEAEDFQESRRRVLAGERVHRRSDRRVSRRIPRRVRQAIDRGLSLERGDRFPSMEALIEELQPRPRRRFAWGLMPLAVGAIGVWSAWPEDASGRCIRQAVDRTADLWGAQRRASIASTAERYSVRPAELLAHLDAHVERYLGAWRAVSRASCRATFVELERSGDAFELTGRCLTHARNYLDGSLDALEESVTQEGFERALEFVYRQEPLEVCLSPDASRQPLPSDPHRREIVERLYERLDRLHFAAIRGAGNITSEARAIVEDARDAAFPPLLASALERLGGHLTALGHYGDAVPILEEAIVLAAKSNEAEVEAKAWAQLIHCHGGLDEVDSAWKLELAGRGAVERADSLLARSWLLNNTAGLHLRRKDFDQALAALEQSLELKRTSLGDSHIDVVLAHQNLAAVLVETGDAAGASVQLELARDILAKTVGLTHPRAALNLALEGRTAQLRDEHELAVARFEKFLAEFDVEVTGRDVRRLVEERLSWSLRELGRLDDARAAAVRALDVCRKELPHHVPRIEAWISKLDAEAERDRAPK